MKNTKRKRSKSTTTGRSVIRSLKEIRAWQEGKGTLRVLAVPDPIPAVRIKAIRKKVAKSVRVFSEQFGLRAKTVQQWEQGTRRPHAAGCLHLELIDFNPERVAA